MNSVDSLREMAAMMESENFLLLQNCSQYLYLQQIEQSIKSFKKISIYYTLILNLK
jgi:hypothetical protein